MAVPAIFTRYGPSGSSDPNVEEVKYKVRIPLSLSFIAPHHEGV